MTNFNKVSVEIFTILWAESTKKLGLYVSFSEDIC